MLTRGRRDAIIANIQLTTSHTWNALHANGLFVLTAEVVVVAGGAVPIFINSHNGKAVNSNC